MNKPIKIERTEDKFLKTVWSDGYEASIKLESLRKNCPCATCRDERDKASGQKFMLLNTFKAGQNELTNIQAAGNYAIVPTWGDGHDTGIYTWEVLREIFENNKI